MDIQYIFRKTEEGRQCSHPLSLHPCSLFLSVIVIFERLDWRQWQKREGETCCHSCTLCLSLYASSSSPLFSISSSSCPEVKFECPPTPNHLSLYFSIFDFHLSLATALCFSVPLFASISGLSLSPSLSLVFRQWNICCLNILPHYLSV